MTPAAVFGAVSADAGLRRKIADWQDFLRSAGFDFSTVSRIDLSGEVPQIFDLAGNRFAVDFANDKKNYGKPKLSLKKELISRAVGAGRYGRKILDLSAGMAQDAVFLAQLGYEVTAVERSPLLYLALAQAQARHAVPGLRVEFGEAEAYLQTGKADADVIYFDPMFPEKSKKSALPRQEMAAFKNLVGADADADRVLQAALRYPGARRVVVKRPRKAPWLGELKPQGAVEGKLIRFDIYGVKT